MPLLWLSGVIIGRIDLGCASNLMGVLIGWQLHYCCSWPTDDVDPHSLTPWSPTRLPTRRSCAEPRRGVVQEQQLGPFHHWFREIVTAPQNSDHNRKFKRPMAKETHIKTAKKTRWRLGCMGFAKFVECCAFDLYDILAHWPPELGCFQ